MGVEVSLPAPRWISPTLSTVKPDALSDGAAVWAFSHTKPLYSAAVLADTRPLWLMASPASVTLPRSAEMLPWLLIRLVRFTGPLSALTSTKKPRMSSRFTPLSVRYWALPVVR